MYNRAGRATEGKCIIVKFTPHCSGVIEILVFVNYCALSSLPCRNDLFHEYLTEIINRYKILWFDRCWSHQYLACIFEDAFCSYTHFCFFFCLVLRSTFRLYIFLAIEDYKTGQAKSTITWRRLNKWKEQTAKNNQLCSATRGQLLTNKGNIAFGVSWFLKHHSLFCSFFNKAQSYPCLFFSLFCEL